MVPIETSSAYLANERLLLPEDTVRSSQMLFYFCLIFHHFCEIEIAGYLIFCFGQCTKICTVCLLVLVCESG